MDEHNGECSAHPDDLYGSVNPLDFLLEPEVSTRNVPCSNLSNLSNDLGHPNILSNCIDSKVLPPTSFPIDSDFAKCVETIAPMVNTTDCAASNNCVDVFGVIDHGSNSKVENNLDLLSEFVDREPHKDFSLCSLDDEDESQHNTSLDNYTVESDLSGLNSDISPVQTYINNDDRSTNFAETSLLKEEHKVVGNDSECNSQDTQDEEECAEKSIDMGNGHFSAVRSGTRTKSGSTRGRKRKSGDDVGVKGRGASSVKRRQPAVTYHSQISPDQNGIKLKIKKSSGTVQKVVKRRERTKKRRSKKDDDGIEENDDVLDQSSGEQSKWATHLPVQVLIEVFSKVTKEEGCLPFLVRASSVCQLWREAALAPSLWNTIDLTGPWVRDRYKSEAQLAWLCENRFALVEDLNAGGWKVSDKLRVFRVIAEHCKSLRGVTLTGWTGLSGDHLTYLVENCPLLTRIDLTSVCRDGSLNRSAVSLTAMRNMCQIVGDRLTHLTIADNKISGLNQIIAAMSANCPNLEVFDLSNMWNYSIAPLHIEKLQEGCQKLRVLRFSNSNICLAQTSLKEQVASPGFPCLEELSVASIFSLDGSLQRPTIDDNSLERILKTSHKLRLLDVRGCSRISDSSLVRVPAWDLEHLFLSGCYVTKMHESGLELIVQKWSHSLVEMDLGWCTATTPLDCAVTALSERGEDSPLRETLLKHPVMFSHIYSGQGELEITVTRPALMYILGPDDFPYHNIHASQEVDLEEPSNCNILVKVQDIENDDSVHYQEIHRRECRYSDENPLSLFSHYSVSACITECRVRHQIKLCNCSHHMLPAKLLTLKTSELDAATEGIHCMCDISCTESEYDVVFKNCESVGFGENIRHLRIKMAALPSLRYKRNVIKSSLDLVVCIGSILALFLGASTLSLVEMIMFFCVRPFTIRN